MKRLFLIYLKIKLRFFYRFCNRNLLFIKILKLEGFEVGNDTFFFDPNSTTIDRERPWMLKIGAYCKIAKGTIILTHDYSRSVLRRRYGEIIGEARKTVIGDNVFIGMNSIILMGASIGSNVIIGAGSVVSGIVPNDVVIAGNPARIIRSLEEHYNKRKERYIEEGKLYAREFFKRYGRKPSIKDMNSFFPIYLERTVAAISENEININLSGDSSSEILEEFLKSAPIYNTFEEFLVDTYRL